MPLYELKKDAITPVTATTFRAEQFKERGDLQRILKDNISVVADDVMIIAEEFGDWDASHRRIDLLGLDRESNLVVIELKRTEDGGHMDLQAIRYAAMVSTLTFDQAVEAYAQHLGGVSHAEVARTEILKFLGWANPEEERFGQDVRIVLVSGEFSKEITTAVLWLNETGLNITCIRLRLYKLDDRVLLNIEPIIPLPEAAEYQVRVNRKDLQAVVSRRAGRDNTRHNLVIGAESYERLPSRTLVLRVVRAMVQHGVSPEGILEAARDVHPGLFVSAEGHFDSPEFESAVSDLRRAAGRTFDATRYFCRDGELIESGDRTYAVSNQWTAQSALALVRALQTAHPQFGIRVEPAEE